MDFSDNEEDYRQDDIMGNERITYDDLRGYHHEFPTLHRPKKNYREEETRNESAENSEAQPAENQSAEPAGQDKNMTPLLLAAAANKYLDTTVTKFLQNDITVTKFLERSNDVTVTKFLDTTVTKFLDDNDISVTKFLNQKPDDISVTKFLDSIDFASMNDASTPTKYLEMTVIQFLGTATSKFLEANDISVTKFMETALANFLLDDGAVSEMLQENDITVTKFLDQRSNDVTVTKFLDQRANDTTVTKFLDSALSSFLQ